MDRPLPPAPSPTPAEADRPRLAQLAALLRRARGSVVAVDWRRAEQDCDRLAAALAGELGAGISGWGFAAIPRGGLIVLGMLAYLLDLPAEALAAPPPAGAPVVVVDDCALTGARFAAALGGLEGREVVFAHLYSPPPLRRAIEDAEPRVRRCLAGRDLAAAAPPDADARRAFEERWRRRLDDRRYWLGASEVPVFPWSEPARPFWNPVTGRVEDCWRFAPGSLAGRGRLAPPPPRPPAPVWRPARELVTGELDGVLWLCHTGRERVYTFAGSGAETWRLLARWGDPELAAARLAESFAVSPAEARRDLDRFAAELAAAGLLERAGDDR